MKKIIFIFFLFSFFGYAQIQHKNDGSIYFEKVFEAAGDKAEIKSKVNEWMALNFNDANNVIKMNTEDKIIAKGLITMPYNYKGYSTYYKIHFDLVTDFKDGKYKVLIDNLETVEPPLLHLKKTFLSLDEYKSMSLKIAEEMGTLKQMEKLMGKGKYLELYEQAKLMNTQTISEIEDKLKLMAENIDESIKAEFQKSDW